MAEERQCCWGRGVWSRSEGVTKGKASPRKKQVQRGCRGCGGGEVRRELEAEAEQTWWDIEGHCKGFAFYCEACGGFSS